MLLVCLMVLQGCGKRLFNFKSNLKEQYRVEEIEFEYLSSRTKFKYKNGKDKTRANAFIRMKKDSIIWFRLTPGAGIEAARGTITQDSLILVDKINKQVFRYSFETLSQEYNFEFNFDLFQSVLIGNMPIPASNEDAFAEKGNKFVISQTVGDLNIDNTIDEKTRKLEDLEATSTVNDNTLSLKYSEFKELNDKPFAYKAEMLLNYFVEGKKEQATIDIEHKRVKIEEKELKFPLIIPAKYERK